MGAAILTRISLLPDKIISSVTATNAYTAINDVHIYRIVVLCIHQDRKCCDGRFMIDPYHGYCMNLSTCPVHGQLLHSILSYFRVE